MFPSTLCCLISFAIAPLFMAAILPFSSTISFWQSITRIAVLPLGNVSAAILSPLELIFAPKIDRDSFQRASFHQLRDTVLIVTENRLQHILIVPAYARRRPFYLCRSARQQETRTFNHGPAHRRMFDFHQIAAARQLWIAPDVGAVLNGGRRDAPILKQPLDGVSIQ